MKNTVKRSLLLGASVSLVLLCSACSGGQDSDVSVPFELLPAAVQKTISDNSAGHTVDKVEKMHKDGNVVYEAKVVGKKGMKQVIDVDADGKLLSAPKKSAEVKVSWKKLPKAVQKTISAQNGGKKLASVEKEVENGVTVYEAKIKAADGSDKMVKVSKSGKLIEPKN